MKYRRMTIELESPEQLGYDRIAYNLSESSYSDQLLDIQKIKDLPNLLLCYGDHLGNPDLRQAIAQHYGLQAGQVLITAGAAAALFIVASSILSADDELIVMSPNYASNIETPRAIDCRIHLWQMDAQNNWALDFDRLEHLLKHNRIKLISLTTPHNPTGKMIQTKQLLHIIALADQYNCYVLVDETYRDLSFINEPAPLAATLSDRVISVSSLSKAYGMPGLRIGWLLCQNKTLNNLFLAAKEQIFLCNPILEETIALQVWQQKTELMRTATAQIKIRYDILKQWLQTEANINAELPDGGAVCFAHIHTPINTTAFYDQLLHKYYTYVGRGAWFDMPDTYLRIGFAYPTTSQLQMGLNNISEAIEKNKKL